MAFQAAQNTAVAELLWTTVNGGAFQNNLHFQKAAFVEADMDALGAAVISGVTGAAFLANLSSDVLLDNVVVTDLRTEGALSKVYACNIPGTNGTDAAVLSDAVVVTLRTALRGRSYRGRVYLAGISDGSILDNQIAAAVCTNAEALINDIATDTALQGWTLSVLSRWHNGALRATAIPQAVIDWECRNTIPGSQRRRNRRP